MFSRIKASITGEVQPPSGSSPESSRPPHAPPPKNHVNRDRNRDREAPHTPPQRQGGLLPPFFANPPPGGGSHHHGSESRQAVGAPPQAQERPGFFSGPFDQSSPPLPGRSNSNSSVEASPGTIRASAAALLKMAAIAPPLHHPEINPHSSNDGIDNVDLAQRDTLEHQISRRDAYITKLQSDLHRLQSQLAQHRKDNHTLRRQQLESTHRHSIAVKLWRRTNDGLRARVECFESETTPAAAREIANLIRDAAPPNKDSAYLMMLQDQLTKATAKLDHLGSQTEIVLHKGEEVVESLREEMNEVIRERCRMELELLDQERMLEDDMRRMVNRTERRLRRVQGEIDFLEKNAVECLKNQEDEEEEAGEGSGEEDESKDEAIREKKENKKDGENGEEEGEGDESSSDGSDSSSSEESNDDRDEAAANKDKTKETPKNASPDNGKPNNGKKEQKEPEHTPEDLRKELRHLAQERDRSLSVLQRKLREKNEEYHSLARLREQRLGAIHKFEEEKRDREEWERSRQEGLMP